MSRPKEYYYGDIKKWIMMIDRLPTDREQTEKLKKAIAEAYDETSRMQDGLVRLIAIDKVLFEKKETYTGVADDLHYDWRTIQNWVTAFVNLVGKKAGY